MIDTKKQKLIDNCIEWLSSPEGKGQMEKLEAAVRQLEEKLKKEEVHWEQLILPMTI